MKIGERLSHSSSLIEPECESEISTIRRRSRVTANLVIELMPSLYLSAPRVMVQHGNGFYRDFFTILQSGIGPDYAIYQSLKEQISCGMPVVVFDRDRSLRAEGIVSAIVPKRSNRIQRYDVQIQNLRPVSYSNPPKVNRCGVAIV
jgi:hypothetical protein